LEEDKALVERRVRRAFQTLLIQRGRNPGVKGWELKRHLGREYKRILELLSVDLAPLGLEVFEVKSVDGQEDSTRYFLRFKEAPSLAEAENSGFRIDDLAVLASSIAYISSKQGRLSRKELEHFLREKFPRWRVDYSLDRYVKKGYLEQDEGGLLRLGWRTKAEIDQKTLMTLILARGTEVSTH
jgi:hypothetical protein